MCVWGGGFRNSREMQILNQEAFSITEGSTFSDTEGESFSPEHLAFSKLYSIQSRASGMSGLLSRERERERERAGQSNPKSFCFRLLRNGQFIN